MQLLATGKVDCNSRDGTGKTSLHHAAKKGHEAVAQVLLATDRVLLNVADDSGATPLHLAARNGHLLIVTRLLGAESLDPNAQDSSGQTPLHYAVMHGGTTSSRSSLDADVIVLDAKDHPDLGQGNHNYKDWETLAPFSSAASAAERDEIKLPLVSRPDDVDCLGSLTDAASLLAVKEAINIVGLLLADSRINPNITDMFGNTLLFKAVESRSYDMTRILLATGRFDPNQRNFKRITAVSYARKTGLHGILNLLKDYKRTNGSRAVSRRRSKSKEHGKSTLATEQLVSPPETQ
ncbi:MAG: hypothetical protein LQ340_004174 [Diploschistes diacapsis]|nr:MAG: hypothetical protein LQ340_004174 [Diploschistes diacapsis]